MQFCVDFFCKLSVSLDRSLKLIEGFLLNRSVIGSLDKDKDLTVQSKGLLNLLDVSILMYFMPCISFNKKISEESYSLQKLILFMQG